MKVKNLSKKIIIKNIIIISCFIIAFIFVYNDAQIYSRPVACVTNVENSGHEQELTLQIKNTGSKGKILKIHNTYDPALVYDEKYHKGDQVFVSTSEKEITGIKRDYQIAASVLILFALLLVFGRKQGVLTVISFFVSIFIFCLMMWLYTAGYDVLWLSIGACVILASAILIFICGLSKNVIPPLAATLMSMTAVGIMVFTLLWFGSDIGYEYLDFLPQPYSRVEANHFFLAQTLIGCLGAVMDITVTITACLRELIRKNPDIGVKDIILSAREVSDDITGTMINVVFFTNIAATIPTFIVSMKNEVGFLTVMKYGAFFDISRFLAGGIAILIATPFSIMTAFLFCKKEKIC